MSAGIYLSRRLISLRYSIETICRPLKKEINSEPNKHDVHLAVDFDVEKKVAGESGECRVKMREHIAH